jgi:hypothetical protein
MTNPESTYPVRDGHSPSASVPSTMAPPMMLGGHAPLASLSPRQISPSRTGDRRHYTTKASSQSSRTHKFVEQPGDRPSGKALTQPLSSLQDHVNPRGLSRIVLDSLPDPAYQFSRHGLPQSLGCSNTTASTPSMSSTISSSAATPNSTYTTSTSMEHVRFQRSLPPLSTVGLEPLVSPAFTDSNGQPNFSSPTYLPNSHTLPPPLNSPFLSSSSSGKHVRSLNSVWRVLARGHRSKCVEPG